MRRRAGGPNDPYHSDWVPGDSSSSARSSMRPSSELTRPGRPISFPAASSSTTRFLMVWIGRRRVTSAGHLAEMPLGRPILAGRGEASHGILRNMGIDQMIRPTVGRGRPDRRSANMKSALAMSKPETFSSRGRRASRVEIEEGPVRFRERIDAPASGPNIVTNSAPPR